MTEEEFQEEMRVLAMAASVGLSSHYDATRDSYAGWRIKILKLTQLIKEHELGKTVRSDSDH